MHLKRLVNVQRYGVYNFFQKETKYVDPRGKAMRVHKGSKWLVMGLACITAASVYAYSPSEKEIIL
jgi:hypothetical protein